MNNRTKIQIILCIIGILGLLSLFIIQNDLIFIILISIGVIGMIIGMSLDVNNEEVSKWFDKTNFFNKNFKL
jgi:lipid-A-disaccharide synthase-like uncharacterized protein